jgi:2-iminobutanoate/2-iminopropanoate deaminase
MRLISSRNAPTPVAAYSQAVENDGLVFTAGQLGTDPNSGELADGVEAQADQAFRNISAILQEAGSSFRDVLKVNIFMADLGHFAAVNAVYERYVGSHRPARTTTGAAGLPKGALIEVDVIAAKSSAS